MACLPDGRSRREGFPLLGQHKQAGFYAEFENNLLVEPGPDLAVTLGQYLAADDPADLRVRDLAGPAGEGEAVVLPGRRADLAVQRVAPVPAQVGLLGPGDDEQVQSGRADHRADRVHPRAAVGTDGGQEAQADAELVEVLAPGLGQGGLLPLELVPRDHAEGRYPGIADILCQRFSPSLMRCVPTGWCPWSCSCRRAAA